MSVTVENNPVIFPRLVRQLLTSNKLVLSGKRRSDLKLLALLQNTNPDGDPDIMILRDNEWYSYRLGDETLELKFKDISIPYDYQALRCQSVTQQISFLNVIGSASVSPVMAGKP